MHTENNCLDFGKQEEKKVTIIFVLFFLFLFFLFAFFSYYSNLETSQAIYTFSFSTRVDLIKGLFSTLWQIFFSSTLLNPNWPLILHLFSFFIVVSFNA